MNRTHNTENELVTSKETWYTYDDNGNLVEDPEYHYRWDFKNRLREVWTNESTPQLVAEYWYDSENRRTKKAVDSVPTVYFLDSWNEVQESDCFGVPLRQYVYGAGVDELIMMDRPVVDVGTVQETCALLSGGGTSDLEPTLEECQDVTPTATPPGFDGSCGPCSTLLTTSAQAFVTDTSCNVCVSSAWNYLERDEPSPVSGCMTCDADSTIWFGATAIVVTPEAGCTPCAPNMHGVLVIDYSLTHIWSAEAEASSGCTPCPVPDQEEGVISNATSPVPEAPKPNPHPEEHCFGVNLDERLYFLQDEQRSVYGLANKDGELKQGFEYDPYGNVTVFTAVGLTGVVSFTTSDDMGWADDSESPYLYTGRRYDPESGLMQYRTRYYDVDMGRFISRDTIGVWGDPNSLGNAYGYCADRAHECTDPMGEGLWKSMKKGAKKAANVANKVVGVVENVVSFKAAFVVTAAVCTGRALVQAAYGDDTNCAPWTGFCGNEDGQRAVLLIPPSKPRQGIFEWEDPGPLSDLDAACWGHDVCVSEASYEANPDNPIIKKGFDTVTTNDEGVQDCNQELAASAAVASCFTENGFYEGVKCRLHDRMAVQAYSAGAFVANEF